MQLTRIFALSPVLFTMLAFTCTSVQAQLVTYRFTGTKTRGTAGIGDTISGEITLDLGAEPDSLGSYSGSREGAWYDGNFSIKGITDTGISSGSGTNGWTNYINEVGIYDDYQSNKIAGGSSDETTITWMELYSESYNNPGDGVPSVADPWDAMADEGKYIFIVFYDATSGQYDECYFSIDTFANSSDSDGDGVFDSEDACPDSDLSPTVVIGDVDTGVENVLLDDGCTISDLITACAAAGGNHGDFVSCVADLTNDLKKDGVISGKEKGKIQSAAAKFK